ncbi:hypothetical protein LOOC260_102930 [Paucilactobacillus hokkaidonensis JCM 18461]|uniref:Uncharacterized protein n=2 Tax=Paucilactobacillus hokkaidonensis TaxID=1193095 RepID=A0A0A1GWS7_9LACO|nr:hypothetical protein [Paucilactobacillus hokkaidonensis]KRO09365.1 hypothetical protein IV59_GL000703 [Paucilactobacillus hokkaidonensis]BAP84871.1 hypothetical protein LOOC260_102930 [Paucilactobacillus hokkaidonensis JCM 18461]
MTSFLLPLAMTDGAKVGIAVGALVFIILFIKLIIGFIKFCFRHPVIFIVLLLCGGLGFAFNFLLAGILILAVLAGGVVMFIFNEFG